MNVGIVVFPGTNCDLDTQRACKYFGFKTEFVWHNQTNLDKFDMVFLPGGFSYGDYISSGRIAKFSPVISSLKNYVKAQKGVVVGICNGFQILCEAGLLDGVLTSNSKGKFTSQDVKLLLAGKQVILPIANHQGCFVSETKLKAEEIFLTYQDNPNDSMQNIAGIVDNKNRVFGMMPHPERAVFKELGLTDGQFVFEEFKKAL